MKLSVSGGADAELGDFLDGVPPIPIDDGNATIKLAAHGYRWLRIDHAA